MKSTFSRCAVSAALGAAVLCAQSPPGENGGIFGGASPILSGAFGSSVSGASPSNLTFTQKFEPILLVPLGSKFLFETEYSMELPVERQDSILGPAVLSHSFEYMQMNYFATSNVILTGGHFVTPFGIYKERLDPQWVRNLLDEPLIFPISDNSSIGAMVRASGSLNSQVKMNFAASYSATEGNAQFSAEKQAGGRVSFYLPGPRVEIGASYLRVLGDDRFNVSGLDFVWNARRTPVDVRGEFVWADVEGKGYWLEAAYRLSNVTTNRFFRRSQIVGRVEQYFAPSVPHEDNGDLPVLNTQRYTAGFNYWPSDSVKLCASFGRQIDSSESQNIWTVGIVYRFALGKGE